MANYWHLDPDNEDKIISRQQRIFSDNMIVDYDAEQTITTKSNAPRLKIKFFLDVIRQYDELAFIDNYYRIGRYYELEHGEQCQILNTLGYTNLTFTCSENDGNGSFTWKLVPSDNKLSLYISSVVFEDSFYNPVNGWLNPDNSDNLLSKIVDEVPDFKGGGNVAQAYAPIVGTVTVANNGVNTWYEIYNDNFVSVGMFYTAVGLNSVGIIPVGDYRITQGTIPVEFTALVGRQSESYSPIVYSSGRQNFAAIKGIPSSAQYGIFLGTNTTNLQTRLSNGIFQWLGADNNAYALEFSGGLSNPATVGNAQTFNGGIRYLGKHIYNTNPTI